MTQQINLYNPALAPKVELLSGHFVLLAVAGVLVLALTASMLATFDASRTAEREAVQAARLTQLQGEVTHLAQELAARKPDPRLQEELGNLEALLAAHREVIALIDGGALGDTRGVSEYFRAFARASVDGLWLTGFTIVGGGSSIAIQGRTVDAQLVPRYLGGLRKEEVLRGRSFESLSVSQPPPAAAGQTRPGPEYLQFNMATQDSIAGRDAAPAAAPAKAGGGQ